MAKKKRVAKGKENSKKEKYVFPIILLLLAAAFLSFYLRPLGAPSSGTDMPEEVISELRGRAELADYAGYNASAVLLTEEIINERKATQPALYAEAVPGNYIVVFRSEQDGLIVFYDYEKKAITRMFAVQEINI